VRRAALKLTTVVLAFFLASPTRTPTPTGSLSLPLSLPVSLLLSALVGAGVRDSAWMAAASSALLTSARC
jgi:hypothetical protein